MLRLFFIKIKFHLWVPFWFVCHFRFSGLFPVFSCVLIDKSLIINTIHFSGVLAFSGRCLSEPLIHLIDLIFRLWVEWMHLYVVISVHIVFIVHLLFAGCLPVVSWVLQCNSLIINTIQFCW